MSESNHQSDIPMQNQRSLAKLVRAIRLSLGRFSLIVVRCNYDVIKPQISSQLRQQGSGLQVQEVSLGSSATNLYTTLQGEIGSPPPDVVIVSGFELVRSLDDLLISMNQVRDDFSQTFPFPLVLWINDFVLQKFVRLAPDCYSYAGAPIQFVIATDELIEFLHQQTERVFNGIFANSTNVFISPTDIGKPWEIETAVRELENRGCHQPELQASVKFILGRDSYINHDMVRARQLWEESLSFWQVGELEGRSERGREERRACILFHLGLWWRRYAVQHRGDYEEACTQARDYYQQCVDILEQINSLDLVAQFISSLGETLLQLRQWDKLEQVAHRAIELHQTYANNTRLAYAYGFLAEVALGRENWHQAKEYGEIALDINQRLIQENENGVNAIANRHVLLTKIYQSWYLFLISQAQQHLEQIPSALEKLTIAKQATIPDYYPQLYIRILESLQNLYFQLSEYLQAFHMKQEKFAVEQQYGLRAFIGAGRLRSQRPVIHPALVPLASVGLDFREPGGEMTTGDIAQEIKASGRQRDVERLVERLSRADHKLIVIHGPSGVGKSSLLMAGLVPALQQITMMEGRQPLPVVVRVYTDWLGEVRNQLVSTTGDDLLGEILAQLRHNAAKNLLTILIFDQFEEFFFNCPQPGDRREFWEFLHQCLDSIDIPYVKVILSLRSDYLHYLLECDRLSNLQATNNDILNKDIRYYFGNFSPEEAKTVIYSLTENSAALEPALIDELVRDLAGDVGEVRPIELQVVGTQLETEKITTLAGYQESGPKEKLVDRFLTAVVQDCGEENERVAQLVLYLLTDENNTRPLKTKAELAEALAAEVDKLDLVLEILVTSGIVFLIPQSPADCYQLVHDYLVAFIRQQRGAELLAELKRERQQRQEAEAKLTRVLRKQLRDAYIAAAGLVAVTAVAVGFGVESYKNSINAEINLMRSESEQSLAANFDREALIESLNAGDKLQRTPQFWVKPDTRTQVVTTLHQAIYGVKDIELKTLKGHNSEVYSVSFSPDGKTIASASFDNTIKLWSVDGKLLKTLRGHSSEVISVSFSPDGKTIASASWDNTIKLWSVDGKLLKTLRGHSSEVIISVSFSP
ncbi:eIF2A-related protein, partial [Calothrix rhizosoleniae]|uniref:nSTAND1 domain-containing NTPase n=1 Tax=Calothrix rhizosoleniae TaxID=888997 RepID=UPI00190E66A8